MTFQAYPTLTTYTVLTGLCTRLEATDSSTRATGGWPLQDTSAINPAAFTSGGKYTFSVWVDKGAGFAEVACFAKGLGRYDNDKYRELYLEIAVDNTVPIYPAITAHVGGAGVGSYQRAKPTAPSAGWAVEVRLTTPSTTSPLTRAVNNTAVPASMWEDASNSLQMPAAWLTDATKRGRTNAVIKCTDPDYLTKCGATPYLLTRAEEQNAALVGAAMAAVATAHNSDFDRYLRDAHWDDISNELAGISGRQTNFSRRVITNSALTIDSGQVVDLTSTARDSRGLADQATWVDAPPQYGICRFESGSAYFGNGNDYNYYDRAQSHRKEYYKTGDLAYYQRFCAIAFAYRHWARTDNAGTNSYLTGGLFVGYLGQMNRNYTYQPQGIAEYYLESGDPHAFTFIETAANFNPNDANFGQSTQNNSGGSPAGEPRPMARLGHLYRWAHLLSRPANASYPEGNTAGVNTVDVRDWNAVLADKVDQALNGSAHATSVSGPVDTGGGIYAGFPVPGPQGQYWQSIAASAGIGYRSDILGIAPPTLYTGATVENVGLSTFMQPIVTEWLRCCAHDHPLTSTVKDQIVAAITACARFVYANFWDGTPADNPNVPLSLQPCFRAIFGSGGSYDAHADTYAWYYGRSDLTMMYAHMFAWAAWQTNSAELRAIAERILVNGVKSAYYGQAGSKQTQEAFVYFADAMATMALAPAAGPITTYDVPSEVHLPASTILVPVGSIASLTAMVRDTRRVKLTRTNQPTVSSANSGIATGAITSTTTDETGTLYGVTVTGVSAGTTLLTVHDPDSGLSTAITATVAVGITDTFTAADNTPIAGRTTETGGAVWSSIFGPCKVTSNAAVNSAGSGDAGALCETGSPDALVTITVGSSSTTPGVFLRAIDTSNYILAYYFAGAFTLNRKVAGALVTWSDAATLAIGDTISLAASGNTITLSHNGAAVRSVTIPELASVTTHGFYAGNSAVINSVQILATALSTATKLALSVQPSGAVSGATLAVQPSGTVQDVSSATVTGDTSTVSAAWVGLTGNAVATGTTTAVCVAGVWTFATLGLSWSVASTGYWHFTDGSLTAVDSSTLTLGVSSPAAAGTLPTPIDLWRPKPTREGLRVVVSPSTLIGTGGLVAVASNTVSVHIPIGRVQVSVLSFAIDGMVAAAGSGAITVTVSKVTAAGVVTPLTAAKSIKSDVVTSAGNIALPLLASVFGGAADGSRKIDGTRGDYLRVDITAAGTVTTQPQVRIVAELGVTA